jgi:hypothetical protein
MDNTLPKCVREELEDIKKQERFVRDNIQAARDAEEVVEMFKDVPELQDQGEDGSRSVGHLRASFGSQIGQLRGALIFVDVVDIRAVLPVLRELRRRGYKVKDHDDYAEIGRRTYNLSGDGGEIKLGVFVGASFSSDAKKGAVCKFVQVGIEEKPVFKLLCDDTVEVDLEKEVDEQHEQVVPA